MKSPAPAHRFACCVVGVFLLALPLVPASAQSSLVTTLPASDLLNDAATLNGTVNPNGMDTIAWFEWGNAITRETNLYPNTTPLMAVGSGAAPVPVSAGLTGLTPGVTYRFRVVASNSVTVTRGAVQTFWSPAIVFNGPDPLTNECHVAFADQTTANASPVALAAGKCYSLALRRDGTVVSWGWNTYGQPNDPDGANNFEAIATSGSHSLALRGNGTLIAWGDNSWGQTNIPVNATGAVAIAAGGNHSLALKVDGSVVGWGYNAYGQTTIPASATNVIAIRAGFRCSLALKDGGTVVGWGENLYGQTTIPVSATGVVAIAAGGFHSLALKGDGSVVGWGINESGQTNIPVIATNVVAIAAGSFHSLALKGDGTVVAWGNNGYGQTTIPSSATNVVAIEAGGDHSLALKGDGTVVAWGRNDFGQTTVPANVQQLNLAVSASGKADMNMPGVYMLTYSATNALGAAGTTIRSVVVADTQLPVLALLGANPTLHTLGASFTDPGATAIDSCAGDLTASVMITDTVNINVLGQYTNIYTVTDASGNMAQIARSILVGGPLATTMAASGLLDDTATLNGTLNPSGVATTAWFEWGNAITQDWNRYPNTTPPVAVGSSAAPVPVSAGLTGLTPGVTYRFRVVASNSVAVTRGAAQTFWSPAIALNSLNPLTNECHVTYVDPGATASALPIALAANIEHSLALKADRTVVAWGDNTWGQTTIPASATNISALAAGRDHNLALRGDGMVVAWGNNYSGQTTIPSSVTNVVAIAAGNSYSLAIKGDGTVFAWGYNEYGQTDIPANATNVVAIAAGQSHGLALKIDGTVVAWGRNNFGQTTIPASASNVVAIAAGDGHSLALKEDGSVLAWGSNEYGQTNIPASVTNIVALAAGAAHNLALRDDGTVVAWGRNYYGQTTVPANATNILALAAGLDHSMILKGDGSVIGWGQNYSGQTTIPAGLSELNLPVSVSGTVDTNTTGVYLLTYSATNSLSAIGTATRSVVVADTRPPVLALLGANPLMHTLGASFTDPGATGSDLCAGDLTASVVITDTVNTSVPGHYANIYTAIDASGNTTQITRNILVGGPQATTLPASGLLNDVATLNGTVNPNGVGTTAWFEWGSNITQDWNRHLSTTPAASVGSGPSPVTVSAGLTGLIPGVTYRYRMVASNSVTVTRGQAQTFWSPAITLNGLNPLTNECHVAFLDPGAKASASPVALAAGGAHNLAVKQDGAVVAWGWNTSSQTNVPASATNAVAIAAGGSHSLALKGDGTVVAWGLNTSSQTSVPASATNVVAIAAGDSHSLALKGDGTVVAWGWDYHGQTTIPGNATNVMAIAAGGGYSMALKGDGVVVCWGDNTYGQTNVPASATNVVAIASGGAHSLAFKSDGTVIAWGRNSYGQTNIPVDLNTLNLPVLVSDTLNTNTPDVYLLTYSATNALGAVGTATRAVTVTDTQQPTLTLLGANPLLRALGTPFTDPGATATDLCAGDLSGSIVISNTVNPDVAGSYTNTYTVTDASGNTAQITRNIWVGAPLATTLPASGLLNDAATLNGTVNPNGVDTTTWFEWGSALGYASNTPSAGVGSGTTPVPVSAGLSGLIPGVTYQYQMVASNSVAVTRGTAQTFWFPVIALNGPNPLTNECHLAFADPGAKVNASPMALAAGQSHSLALKADGTVVGWGFNIYGQTTAPTSVTNVVAIAAGSSHNLALKSDGTVVAWGLNSSGQTNIPAGVINAVAIAAGGSHSLALNGNGTVVGWGSTSSGQTEIPASAVNVAAIAAGGSHS